MRFQSLPPMPVWPLVGLLAYVVAYASLLALRPLPESTFVALSDFGGMLPPLVAGGLAVLASRQCSGLVCFGWRLIGAGCLAWGAGEVVWTYYEVGLGRETPFPSLADVGYLGAVPLLFAGILCLNAPRDKRTRLRVGLAALAVVVAAVAISWQLVLYDIFSASDASAMEKVLGGLYPLGDLALLFALVVALPKLRRDAAGVVLGVFAAAMLFFLMADSLFAYLETHDGYAAGSLPDAGWVMGTCLFAAAAYLHYRWQPDYSARAEDTSSSARELAPIVILPFLLGWSLLHAPSSTATDLPTGIALVLYACIVVTRQSLNYLDSLQINLELGALTTRLEARSEFLQQQLADAKNIADRDPLTGVFSRRAIYHELDRLMALPLLDEEWGAVGIVDVDGLKVINDTQGHAAGDETLRRVAAALSLEGAIVGRIGGDEFMMILPGARELQVEAYTALVDWRLQPGTGSEGKDHPVRFSAGFSFYPSESRSPRQLLKNADQRMYEEKLSRAGTRGVA